MRNDSRPIFEHSPASPLGGDEQSPIPSERPDSRDTIAHRRESHIVHPDAERTQPDDPNEPVTPSSDAKRNAKI